MYKDFEDLRDNCPAEIKAAIAIDLDHEDQEKLDEVWPFTGDGEFRLAVTQAVSDFWENAVRQEGGSTVPVDGFAIEIVLDSFTDPIMGSSLYLELHAYCGTEGIGEMCWKIFDDEDRAVAFENEFSAKVPEILAKWAPESGIRCDVELNEVEEL
jgi:hypothetical protein